MPHTAALALMPLAEKYAPEGTQPLALVYQWLHALANNTQPYAWAEGVDCQVLINTLAGSDLLFDLNSLCERIKNGFPINPPSQGCFRFIDLFAGIGGMRIGFQNAGGVCVFSSEFE